MNQWKAITGIILLIVGVAVFFQSYKTVTGCNTVVGKLSTFFTSIFGGNGAQACYDAQLDAVGAAIVAIIGLVIIYLAFRPEKTTRGRRR